MSFYALSGLVNFLTSSFVGLYVFSRNVADRRYQTYGAFCLSLAIWSCGYFFWQISRSSEQALVGVKILMAGAIFIPITNLHHIIELSDPVPWERRWIWLGYALSIGFLCFDFGSPLFIAGVSQKLDFPFWPKPGPVFHFYLLGFFYCVLRFIHILYNQIRRNVGIKRNQFRYLLLALVLGYSGGVTNFLLWYDIPVRPYGNILVSVYVLLFSYAVVKFSLLDINFILKKSIIYAFLLLILILPCYILVVLGQVLAYGQVSYTFSIITLMVLMIVGFLFPKLRFRTEDALERVLFKRRYDYRETLLRSSRDMISVVEMNILTERLVHTISSAMSVDNVSLYIVDDLKGWFLLKAGTGPINKAAMNCPVRKNDLFVQTLAKSPGALIREELENVPNEHNTQELAIRLSDLDAEVSIPIKSKEKLIGFLNLGHKESKDLYSKEDLELLLTLANQAAVAIENARLYENLKESQDTLRRADRLSSLGLLTAGLAHEIRNPLVAIRTFTQLLPERYDDAEFREGFQGLALKEVDRICGLITDLLSFARPSKPNVAPEDMSDVVEGIARILENQAKERAVEIVRDFGANLPKVWIDREQMKQVFMNLILNAIQAMKEAGSIVISTRIYSRNQAGEAGEFVQVEIRDSGIGIPEENLEHIFDPFFTNKDEGSGLGLSISHQIVQEHGGYITVESKLGKGTAFFINLPTGKPIRLIGNGRAQRHEANLSH